MIAVVYVRHSPGSMEYLVLRLVRAVLNEDLQNK